MVMKSANVAFAYEEMPATSYRVVVCEVAGGLKLLVFVRKVA